MLLALYNPDSLLHFFKLSELLQTNQRQRSSIFRTTASRTFLFHSRMRNNQIFPMESIVPPPYPGI